MAPAIALYRAEKKASLKRRKRKGSTPLQLANAKWDALPPKDRGEYKRLTELRVDKRDLGHLFPRAKAS